MSEAAPSPSHQYSWNEYCEARDLLDIQIEEFRLATQQEVQELLAETNPYSVAGYFAKEFKTTTRQNTDEMSRRWAKGDFQSKFANGKVNANTSAAFKERRISVERSLTSKVETHVLVATNGQRGKVQILDTIPESTLQLHENAKIIAENCQDPDVKDLINNLYSCYAGRKLSIPTEILTKTQEILKPSGITICVRNDIAILAKCTGKIGTPWEKTADLPITIVRNKTVAFALREILHPSPKTEPKAEANTEPPKEDSVTIAQLRLELAELKAAAAEREAELLKELAETYEKEAQQQEELATTREAEAKHSRTLAESYRKSAQEKRNLAQSLRKEATPSTPIPTPKPAPPSPGPTAPEPAPKPVAPPTPPAAPAPKPIAPPAPPAPAPKPVAPPAPPAPAPKPIAPPAPPAPAPKPVAPPAPPAPAPKPVAPPAPPAPAPKPAAATPPLSDREKADRNRDRSIDRVRKEAEETAKKRGRLAVSGGSLLHRIPGLEQASALEVTSKSFVVETVAATPATLTSLTNKIGVEEIAKAFQAHHLDGLRRTVPQAARSLVEDGTITRENLQRLHDALEAVNPRPRVMQSCIDTIFRILTKTEGPLNDTIVRRIISCCTF